MPTSPLSRFGRRLSDAIEHRLYRQQWNCAVIKRPIAEVAGLLGEDAQSRALDAALWLPEPKGGFVADPFGYRVGPDDDRILVEMYDWKRAIGTIATCRFDGRMFGPYETLLDAASHLSYPFVLHHGGETLFVPENAEAREVSAYGLAATGAAVRKRSLIRDRPLIDSSIVVRDGRYWLFGVENAGARNAELNIHIADDLFGAWRPHARNPVKVDLASARPAGTPFEHEGQLYRPAQDCSRRYGGSVVVNRVLELTETSFAEEPAALVSPKGLRRYDHGLHTLSQLGDYTLIDAARKMPSYWPG